MYPPIGPIIFQLGPLTLRWYGVLIMTGAFLATWTAARYVQRKEFDPETVWNMLLWVLFPGLLGARLYYVFVQSPRTQEGFGRFVENPAAIFAVWEGGLHIYGGFVFGALGLWYYTRRNKLPTLVYFDALALGLPLAQAVARWANFINQELYGPPTTLPWGLRIDADHRIAPYNDPVQYPESTRFHPLFLYESLWNFLGFGIIFAIVRRYGERLRPGDVLLMYLFWYPLGRFFIEFLRTDSWFFGGGFNAVHLLSAVSVIAAATLLFLRHRNSPSTQPGTAS